MNLPPEYKEWIPRVSNLVEYFNPFKGTNAYGRYVQWAKREGICPIVYTATANKLGTKIHNSLEAYLLWEKQEASWEITDRHIYFWEERLDELFPDEVCTEVYVREKEERFQWMVDLLYKKDWKWVMADYKTYWIAKLPYGLAPWTLAVDKKKREKVNLQMSLYAYALWQQGIKIEGLELVYLHTSGIRVYEMQPLSKKEIKKKLDKYQKEKKKEPISLSNIFFN